MRGKIKSSCKVIPKLHWKYNLRYWLPRQGSASRFMCLKQTNLIHGIMGRGFSGNWTERLLICPASKKRISEGPSPCRDIITSVSWLPISSAPVNGCSSSYKVAQLCLLDPFGFQPFLIIFFTDPFCIFSLVGLMLWRIWHIKKLVNNKCYNFYEPKWEIANQNWFCWPVQHYHLNCYNPLKKQRNFAFSIRLCRNVSNCLLTYTSLKILKPSNTWRSKGSHM